MTTIIAKTILEITSMIDGVCNSILESNKTLTRKSMNHDTYETAQKILDNIECSDELHNLKVFVMEWIEDLPESLQQIIKLRYFDKIIIYHIAIMNNVTQRTIYRMLEDLNKSLADYLEKIEPEYFDFNRLLSRNDWIRNEYKSQILFYKMSHDC